MASPFESFQNATIIFTVPDGTHTTNSSGNRKFGNKQITIQVYLNIAKSKEVDRYAKEIQDFAGADSYAMLLQGYLVDPMTYPEDLPFLSEPGEIAFKVTSSKTEEGEFKLLPIAQNACISTLGLEIVTPILGIFRRK